MDELFVYDEAKGLFKEILKQSSVMEGRYHVSHDGGQDLNSNNLATLIGEVPQKKYPLCVCVTPRSRICRSPQGTLVEEFVFNLFFVCKSYNVGNGMDAARKATHDIPYDWKDMKQCAMDFLIMLDDMTRKKKLASGLPIGVKFNINLEDVIVKRLTKFSEDRVSGVWITFGAKLDGSSCEIKDYQPGALDLIVVPNEVIHEQHKHL